MVHKHNFLERGGQNGPGMVLECALRAGHPIYMIFSHNLANKRVHNSSMRSNDTNLIQAMKTQQICDLMAKQHVQ